MRHTTAIASCVLALCWPAAAGAQTVLRVDCTASDASPDGSTWVKAYPHLNDALTAATGIAEPGSPVEIWVAECTYMPDGGSAPPVGVHTAGSLSRLATFQLIDNVEIYGGFPTGGGGGIFSSRDPDPETNQTMLSGDLDGDDGPDFAGNAENSYHVVTGSGTDTTAVLAGFTVTGGNADGPDPHAFGGGMYNDEGSPSVIDFTFIQNATLISFLGGGGGGGIMNRASSPTLLNCRFLGNNAGFGGAIVNAEKLDDGDTHIGSSPTVTNCVFSENAAVIGGGAMYNAGFAPFDGSPVIGSDPTVTNCTFSENIATGIFVPGTGGGIFNDTSSPTITNCILWRNEPVDDTQIWNNNEDSNPVVTYSCIGDVAPGDGTVYPGVGNIDTDPQFVDADLRLTIPSSGFNTGNSYADTDANTPGVQPLPSTDLDGHPRIMRGRVDMGAYEILPPAAPALTDRALASTALLLAAVGAVLVRRRSARDVSCGRLVP